MKASERIGQGPDPVPKASDKMGVGNPALTVQKRKEFSNYRTESAMSGGAELKWEAWLDAEGYALDSAGHVYKKSGQPAEQ